MSLYVRYSEYDENKMELVYDFFPQWNTVEFDNEEATTIAFDLVSALESIIIFVTEQQGEFNDPNFWAALK